MPLSNRVTKLILSGATALAITGAFLSEKESSGRIVTTAYQDGAGIWTICDGLTTYQGKKVYKGMSLTPAQCTTETTRRQKEALAWVNSRVKPAVVSTLTPPQLAGVASFCYWNLGPSKCMGSTFWKRLNEGRLRDACDQVKLWIRDGGKDCRIASNGCLGQVSRRDDEAALICWGIPQINRERPL
jgi:lysozyme